MSYRVVSAVESYVDHFDAEHALMWTILTVLFGVTTATALGFMKAHGEVPQGTATWFSYSAKFVMFLSVWFIFIKPATQTFSDAKERGEL